MTFTRSTAISNFVMVNVSVTYQDSKGTQTYASSWPDTGLAGAGLSIAEA